MTLRKTTLRVVISVLTYGIPGFLLVSCGILGNPVNRWEVIIWALILLMWIRIASAWRWKAQRALKLVEELTSSTIDQYTVWAMPPEDIEDANPPTGNQQ